MIKVSIIINCFNGETYLKDALESINHQSFRDYEIIFIDNCSTDHSAEIAKKNQKLKYYKTEYKITLGKGRNFALEKCTGEYIAFLDCDDLWEPNKLENQVNFMEANKNVVLATSNYIEYNMKYDKKKIWGNVHSGIVLFNDLVINYQYAMSTWILRKNVINKYGIKFDENLSFTEDYDFFTRVACHGAVYYDCSILAIYRVHSTMTSKQIKPSIPGEYRSVLANLERMEPDVLTDNDCIKEHLIFTSDFIQAKIYFETNKIEECCHILKKYALKHKKAFALFALCCVPRFIGYGLYDSYYKRKIL